MIHHDPAKRVLYLDKSPEDVAKMVEMDVEKVNGIIERGKKKLLAARETRIKRIIDTALYSSLNGMYTLPLLKAYRVLKDEEMKGFALKSLEKILTINTDDDNLLHTPGVKGLLDDHIHLIDALVSAYEVTGVESYIGNADLLMSRSIELFWDKDQGSFFDTDEEVLGTRLKGIEDIPSHRQTLLPLYCS